MKVFMLKFCQEFEAKVKDFEAGFCSSSRKSARYRTLVAADNLMGSLSLLYPVAMRLHGAKQNQVVRRNQA